MGNRSTKLSWSWPLVSLSWVPEIISTFGDLMEQTWTGLKREMVANATNKKFSSNIFKQLQSLLTETSIVEEKGRIIQVNVKPYNASVRNHLVILVEESSEPWAKFFYEIYKKKISISYSQIKENPPIFFPELALFPVFKQWSSFFQYIGYGFLIQVDHFMPSSSISEKLVQDSMFVQKCLKAIGDPRHLTGSSSLHTERDFLSWTKGEDWLPLSEDRNLKPRIPFDLIKQKWKERWKNKDALQSALDEGGKIWAQMIYDELNNCQINNLESFILSCKTFIDYFLFGKSRLDNDFLDTEKIQVIRKRWDKVYLKVSPHLWKILPNLYKDITRLYWGIRFYRNSLRKPFLEVSYDDGIFKLETEPIKKLPIRCSRSKRSLYAILKTLSQINISLSRLSETSKSCYRNEAKKLFQEIENYMPSNQLERTELLEELYGFIILNSGEKMQLENYVPVNQNFGYPEVEDSLLQLCFWVHNYFNLQEMPQCRIIGKVKRQLETIQEKFIKEIKYYEKHQSEWDIACAELKKILSECTDR